MSVTVALPGALQPYAGGSEEVLLDGPSNVGEALCALAGRHPGVVDRVMDERGLEQLLKNQFKVGGDASVAAGPVGRDAEASTDIQLRARILSYSRTRGLFAGVTLKGSTIRQDRDANERFYGRGYSNREILLERLGGAPDPVAGWRDELTRAGD